MAKFEAVDGNPFFKAVEGNPFVARVGAQTDVALGVGEGLKRAGASLADAAGGGRTKMFLQGADKMLLLGGALTGKDTSGARKAVNAITSGVNRGSFQPEYIPQTKGGRAAETVTEMLPNAVLAPGGLVPRVAAVAFPAVGSEVAGAVARRTGHGEYEPQARLAGAVVGGLGASGFTGNALRPRVTEPVDLAANAIRSRTKVGEIRARYDRQKAAGAEPTYASVTDASGQGLIRAAATRADRSRELVERRAEASRHDLPNRVSRQVRAKMTGDRRGGEQLRTDLTKERADLAAVQFREPYETQVPIPDHVASVLLDEPGKAALRSARATAVERMDDVRVKEIDALLAADAPLDLSPAAVQARAAEQGFGPTRYYHGTGAEFDDLRPSADGAAGAGVYVSETPTQANSYAAKAGMEGGRPNVRPVYVRAGKAEPVRAGDTIPESAAKVVRDPADVRSTFDQFPPPGYKAVPKTVSAATLDRTRIAMGERGEKLSRGGNRARAGGSFERKAIIDGALDVVPAIKPARAAYRDMSRRIDATTTGEGFLKTDADIFGKEAPGPGQLGNNEALATAARAVERAAGENISSAPGVARKIAYSPEQQARNRALLGEEGAVRLEAGMGAEHDANAALQAVAPSNGSQTQPRTADQERLGAVVEGAKDIGKLTTGGPMGWLDVLANRAKSFGLSKQQAEALADVATDPARTEAMIQAVLQQPNGEFWAREIRKLIENTRKGLPYAPAYAGGALPGAQAALPGP